MNITVSIEELRAYQSKMAEWARDYFTSEVVKEAAKSLESDPRFMGMNPLTQVKKVAEEHMEKNPMPKLIPSV